MKQQDRPDARKDIRYMPNIVLTYRCNLNCCYCFANEFVNKANTDITVRNFKKALDFFTRAGDVSIGLIGGEPTLHPNFDLFMEMLIANEKVWHITVYTNGILMDRYIPQITHPKVGVLVNCNSPKVIGEKSFAKLRQNLDIMLEQYHMKDRMSLGINLYSDDMDYSYMTELLRDHKMPQVRISLTVPDFSTCGSVNVLEFFMKRKPFVLEFLRKMDSIHVMPYYDCNIPPYCIWTDEEKQWLEDYVSRYPKCDTNLTGHQSKCSPTVDILPDLQAIRCFGMSDFEKVNIKDFRNHLDIMNYYRNEIDFLGYKLAGCEECKDCYDRKVFSCVAGCLEFKADRIRACDEAVDRM